MGADGSYIISFKTVLRFIGVVDGAIGMCPPKKKIGKKYFSGD